MKVNMHLDYLLKMFSLKINEHPNLLFNRFYSFNNKTGESMIPRLEIYGLGVVVLVFLGFLGCEPSKSRVPLININASAVATKAMQSFDTDKDGKLSGAELDRAPSLKAAMDIMDTDAKKGISAEQISARINKWAEDKKGLIPTNCVVLHNGKPLADVEVKFVPDSFIADYLTQTASGKTSSMGEARISIPIEPGSDLPPGVPPGFYRVEITKAGENIPACYNAATVLGVEISTDGMLKLALSQRRIQFDLKY
jgi:hypothetical protein